MKLSVFTTVSAYAFIACETVRFAFAEIACGSLSAKSAIGSWSMQVVS
jgi:ABC-type methionine transport system permease subunit